MGHLNLTHYVTLPTWAQACDVQGEGEQRPGSPMDTMGMAHKPTGCACCGMMTPHSWIWGQNLQREGGSSKPSTSVSRRTTERERCVLGSCSLELVFCSLGSQRFLFMYPSSHSLQGDAFLLSHCESIGQLHPGCIPEAISHATLSPSRCSPQESTPRHDISEYGDIPLSSVTL